MKRFHVHLNVADLGVSIRYYQTLFGCPPSVHEGDYAKWMLDDPCVNFAISQRGRAPGIDHLGIQVEQAEELASIGARLAEADAVVLAEQAATCCYARSDKYWSEDPQGLRWESFRSLGTATTYYAPTQVQQGEACCGPSALGVSQCAEDMMPSGQVVASCSDEARSTVPSTGEADRRCCP